MKITYQTKEESKKKQEEAFLALSGGERFMRFLELCEAMQMFPTKAKPEKKNNFVIEIWKVRK